MARPYVTALIDTYNHERFIAQAIESVLAQDIGAREMEVIVVDDGSTDNTGAIVRKFAPRVRYLHKPNGGQASAFNVGIPEARGEIVAFLDGDDWWEKKKLSIVLETLESNPEVGAVGHGYFEYHSKDQPVRLVKPDRPYRVHFKDCETARLFSQLRGFFGTSKLTIRRRVLHRILPIPEELIIEADEFIFTLAPALESAFLLDQPLFTYRFHGGNLFQFGSFDPEKARRKYAALAALLFYLPQRLCGLQVSSEVIATVLEPIWVDAERLRLELDGGASWKTFAVERAAYRLAYKEAGAGYRAFQSFVLMTTLLLPSRRFYQLKRWYAKKGLRNIRQLVGEPTPAAPVIEQE
jgi:glycosyltransferase involved in cell wall biosynthesis